ncbi:NAD-dependent epimerase/dehydratase family protein [Aureispira anguillae]|uniref:NAD-dependent epimerase/dehydratase family protein n=1 Tax=Aureispira anguillae TaxID=2864201 RepID=A0A915YGJ3_9BACT|nr:NAD-dependent epimerase/dehydratase family protein [Aureispira anguillae]BDS12630.1 NAD-dependent epimerase/dehydratase family protein [Aureispira anguillae]
MNKEISLVTGANGHLGNNLVRLLLSKNIAVRATVRNINNSIPFEGLNCELAYADIMNKDSLQTAFKGVKRIYAVGAAFKMWAKNPKKEIYDNNVIGTQNLFEAAAAQGIQEIVYVSSVAALDFTQLPAQECNGYNKDRRNWYYNSKNDSDKLALKLGRKLGIRTVLVLPSAMIGSRAYRLSYSNQLVEQILKGEISVDANVTLNWIDVNDVAWGCYAAMQKGRDGERYILANETHTSVRESVRIAQELFPELNLKIPPKAPYFLLYSIAGLMELSSKITGKEPLLQRHYLEMFYGLHQDYNIQKAKKELGFSPKPSKEALIAALKYLKNDWKNKV